MSLLDHLLFSLLANAAVLAAVLTLRSAPPRMVVKICLAGMLMALVPWSLVGEWVRLSSVSGPGVELAGKAQSAIAAFSTADSQAASLPWSGIAIGVWFAVAALWLVLTFTAAFRTRRQWRTEAVSGAALQTYAMEPFRSLAEKVEVHRLPQSRIAMATGLFRREIWLGTDIANERHLVTALNHELCHIDAGDQYVVHLIAVIERLLWWNPLIWVLGRIARLHLEYACDQRCKQVMGVQTYRRTLAEMALDRVHLNAFPRLAMNYGSGVVTRMEKLTMNYTLKFRHGAALLSVGAAVVLASTTFAAEPGSTLVSCNELVPEGAHYELKIMADLKKGSRTHGELTAQVIDATKPGSTGIPEGAGPYLRCVMAVIGAPDSELPDGV